MGRRRARRRLRVLGQPAAAAGPVGNGQWTGVPLQDGARQGRRQGERARVRLLRRRSAARRKSSSARNKFKVEQQFGRSLPRDKALVDRAVPRLRAERRAADQAPGRAAAPARAGLVRRRRTSSGCREIIVAGGAVPRQVPGALVPHAQGRDDQRRDEVGRDRGHPHAAEVVHRARDARTAASTRCSASC